MFLLLIGGAVLLLIILISSWRLWSSRNRPPGPWGLPILGYLPWLNPERPHVTLTELSHKYGPIYGLWLGGVYTVVLTDYKIIKKALVRDVFAGRAPLYITHGIMNGYGLVCAEGDLWKDQRKFLHGCLRSFGATKSSPKRDKFEELIQNGVTDLLQHFNKQSNTIIDPLPYLRHCLGNVINAYVFGRTWSFDDAVWNWLQILQEEGTKHVGVGGPVNFLPFLRFLPKFKRTLNFLMEGKLRTHKVYQSLIDEHFFQNTNTECTNLIDAFLMEREKRMESNDPAQCYFSDQQFYHLLADVFGASLDTSLTTLRWFILCMASYPHVQERVQDELDSVLNGRKPKFDDLAALPYTEATIAETQRFRSVVPTGIPHGALDDTKLEGYDIPKGTMLIPLQWALHMNPNDWTNPESFDPNRFLDKDNQFVKPDYFMPFQSGKRICVGEDLARMLLFLFGASIVQQFHISLAADQMEDLCGECGITLTPTSYQVIFTPRHKTNL